LRLRENFAETLLKFFYFLYLHFMLMEEVFEFVLDFIFLNGQLSKFWLYVMEVNEEEKGKSLGVIADAGVTDHHSHDG